MSMTDSSDEMFKTSTQKVNHIRSFKLGEEVGSSGVKYWGQDKLVKGETSAMFICGECGNLWRQLVTKIKDNSIKSCCKGSRGNKNDRTTNS